MNPDEIKAIQSRVTSDARDELSALLQAWFDKHQPKANRQFERAGAGVNNARDCGHILGHGVDWFYYGN